MTMWSHVAAYAAGLATLPVLAVLSGPAEKVWSRRPVVVEKHDVSAKTPRGRYVFFCRECWTRRVLPDAEAFTGFVRRHRLEHHPLPTPVIWADIIGKEA